MVVGEGRGEVAAPKPIWALWHFVREIIFLNAIPNSARYCMSLYLKYMYLFLFHQMILIILNLHKFGFYQLLYLVQFAKLEYYKYWPKWICLVVCLKYRLSRETIYPAGLVCSVYRVFREESGAVTWQCWLAWRHW